MAIKSKNIVVVGGGGHAGVVAEAALLSGWAISGYLSPSPSGSFQYGPWLGRDDDLDDKLQEDEFSLALGLGFVDESGAKMRRSVLDNLPEDRLATVIHPQALIAPSANLGAGAFLAAGSIIGTNSTVGPGTLINTGVIVDHDCQIAANVHVATGARITGSVSVDENSLVGAGAVLRQGIRVGKNCVLGAGAVVLSDIADGSMVFGNPAKSKGIPNG